MKILYKSLILIFVSFSILSCNQVKKEPRKEIKLEVFLNDFFDQNPKWNQNDIIKKEVNEKFNQEIKTKIENGILNDFPLELGAINEYKKGKYAAIFNSHYSKSDDISYGNILYNTKFDVIGLITADQVKILQEDKAYLIKGQFKKFLKGDFKNYVNGMVYTPMVEISQDIISKRKEVSIGIILMEITEITETKKL
ncbi:MAG: hypothetical protein PSN34_15760 [Urechidicola sp.]|nr:hypothetical protein [Urechidicola sp.]